MFMVEIPIPDRDRLTQEMNMMRMWLDRQKYEPVAFRHRFLPPGIVFKVEFSAQTEALAFASAFGGKLAGALALG